LANSPKQQQSDGLQLDSEERLSTILRGAFAGAPTPLKDIPTRTGKSRKSAHKKKPQRKLARQRKKRAA
jgi:hypothetical protein